MEGGTTQLATCVADVGDAADTRAYVAATRRRGTGGVVSPTLAGVAADQFGLQAPLWIMRALPLVASALGLGLAATAPRRLRPAVRHQ